MRTAGLSAILEAAAEIPPDAELTARVAWPALVDGRFDVAERAGELWVVIHGTGRGLTPRQQQVAARLGAGESDKAIAYELGLSHSTTQSHVRRVRQKLGLASRPALVLELARRRAPLALGRWLLDDVPILVLRAPRGSLEGLPPGLRAVAEAMLDGRRATEIAAARGTRPRTVVKQIADIYARMGVGSRAELAAKLGGFTPR